MKKRMLSVLSAVVVAVAMSLSGAISAFAAVTDNPPLTSGTGALKWAAKIGAMTPPTIYNNAVYVASGKNVYVINKNTGATMKKSVTLASSLGYTTLPLTIAGGKVFAPLSNGTIEALDAVTLSKITTVTIDGKGQTISPVIYHESAGGDAYLYTGTYNGAGVNGTYAGIDITSGQLLWAKTNPGGYHWAGA